MKEKGISKTAMATVIVVALVVAGVGTYLLMKPGEDGGGGEEQPSGIEWFQTGNTESITQLQLGRSPDLENNRIGDMYSLCRGIFIEDPETSEDPDDFANRTSDTGLKWMRVSIDYFDGDEVEDTGIYSEHYIYPEQDRAITALVNNGIKITCTLVYWDNAFPFKPEENHYRFKTEEEIQRYLDYVQFIVHHFRGRIEYYEILNEPRGDIIEVADYINLAQRTVPVIRQEDPEAKIVVGTIPCLYQPPNCDYLFSILSSDIMPMVDAISWHPMHGVSPEHEPEYYYNYPSIVENIKDTASAHGFNGEYIAQELVWRTLISSVPTEPSIYSETVAAKYYARGIVMHLGMDCSTGVCGTGERPISVIQNLCTVMAGAEPTSLPIEIQSEAENIRSYSFSLSNGDKLIALWTDGVAVDNDPGVNATLTLPNFLAQNVTGIDVLTGYQQSIMASNENGDLVIENLIVRDYPLILRIAESSQ